MKGIRKTTFREIKSSFGRFLAIFAIIALGVGFFAGLKVTKQGMMATVQDYLDRHAFFDYRLLSTMGFEQEDVDGFAGAQWVEAAEGAVSFDIVYRLEDGKQGVAKTHSVTERLNTLKLMAGRMPQGAQECVADSNLFGESAIGSVIYLSEDNEAEDLEHFAYREYTIVGIVRSPLYIQYERGNTSLGTGRVDGYLYLSGEGFAVDYFTEVYVRFSQEHGLYSEEYADFIDGMDPVWEELVSSAALRRYEDIKGEAKEELAEAEAEFQDKKAKGEQELADAAKDLADAGAELEEGEEALADGRRELEEGRQTLARKRQELADAYKMIEEGLQELEEGERTLAQKEADLAAGEQDLAYGWAKWHESDNALQEARGELDAKKAQLDAGQAELDAGKAQYEASLQQFEAGKPSMSPEEIAAAEAQLAAVKAALDQSEAVLSAGWAEYNSGLQEYQYGYSQYQDGAAQVEQSRRQLREAQAELDRGRKELADGQRELAEAKRQLDDAKKELDSGWAEYNDAKAQADRELADAYRKLQDGEAEYANGAGELAAGRQKLEDGRRELDDAQKELRDAQQKLADAKDQLDRAPDELADARHELDSGWLDYNDGRADAEREFADAERELTDAERELADAREKLRDLKHASTYVLTRSENTGYACFESDTSIVAAISVIFPAFFFLVAALVCMTTMTRMVDEQRTQIGVLKALGYSKGQIMSKYLFYAGSAALIGSLVGYTLGVAGLPWIIWEIYGMIYGFAPLRPAVLPDLASMSFAAALLCAMGSTYLACRMELKRQASELIRPKTPRAGRRVFLEYITPLWRRLSFLHKVSVRNVLRYRSRLVMMVLGIGGCTALLCTGFGIRDSIAHVADDQFDEITLYDYAVTFQDPQTQASAEDYLARYGWERENALLVHSGSVDVLAEGGVKSVYLVVSASDTLEGFLSLHNDEGPVAYPGPDQAVLNAGLAESLGLVPGDSIKLRSSELGVLEVTISALCDNYVFNYVYVSTETYVRQLEEAPEYNTLYLKAHAGADPYEEGALLLEDEDVGAVTVNEDTRARVDSMLSRLDYIVVVIVLCAAALAFIVLYNLTNINITERIREIATIKVLGFYQGEVASYVFREINLLSVLGSLAGLAMGKGLHSFVMAQIKIDSMTFACRIAPLSYLISFAMIKCLLN